MSLADALARIMANTRVHLPGALDSAVKLELYNVLNEFLRVSEIWREEIQLNVRTDKTAYEIESEEETAQLVKLLGIVDAGGFPVRGTMPTPGNLVLKYAPTQNQKYVVTVSLTVIDPVTTDGYPRCPEWILTQNSDGVIDGVLGRMMSQPAKPYSSERLATYHLRRFRDAIAGARATANHAGLYDGQAWVFPQNFAPGR